MTVDMRLETRLLIAFALTGSACAARLHEPAPHLEPDWHHRAWHVHCESALSHAPSPEAAPGVDHERWIWAKDELGREIVLAGDLEDGFLAVLPDPALSLTWLQRSCLETLARRNEAKPLVLGRVTAARHGEIVDVPIVLPRDEARQGSVRRVVVFGDSLSDTGLLKRRLRIFPDEPYWLGRFSNGPVWVDYLEAATGLAVANHSYGGAAITGHDPMPHESLIDLIEDAGQFFVSGCIEHQVDDYLTRSLLDGRLARADETAFVLWAGANEYISKEPISAVITTFLNQPEHEAGYKRIAGEAIAALEKQVFRLYAAGARKFVLPNLPDLGHTAIVLQNKGYLPAEPINSEEGRRLELAWRLSALTEFHNESLSAAVARLRESLAEARIVELDVAEQLASILSDQPTLPGGASFDFGFSLGEQRVELTYGSRSRVFHGPCYTGGYLGTRDNHKVCANEATALFWDVVHPSSYTQCWQAWFFENAFADAGWIDSVESPEAHRTWCRRISERTPGMRRSRWMYSER